MNRLQFWFLNGFSLLSALLIVFESYSAQKLAEVTELEQTAQLPILKAQAMQPLARAMVQRTAMASTRDPALRELLTHYGLALAPDPVVPAATTLEPATKSVTAMVEEHP